MEREGMNAAGKFGRQQAVDLLMPGDTAHAGKAGRNHREPEMRIRRRAAVHVAFVQHFEKCRFEFQLQFLFERCLHAIQHPVHGAALYTKIGSADRVLRFAGRCVTGYGHIGPYPLNLTKIEL